MFSKQLMRILAAGASAAAVLGGGTFALASGSPAAAGAAGWGTTFYACVVTHGIHARFPWRSLWKTSAHPVTCPRGQFSVNWNQAGPPGPAGATGSRGPAGPQGPRATPARRGPRATPDRRGLLARRARPGRSAPSPPRPRPPFPCRPAGEVSLFSPVLAAFPSAAALCGIQAAAARSSQRTGPSPDSSTPTGWAFSIQNASKFSVPVFLRIVCATPAGGGSATAPRAQHARIVKETLTKIAKPGKA